MKLRPIIIAVATAGTFSLGALAADDSAQVAATLVSFHSALAHGDSKTAMSLLADDAVILENGSAESRAEYERDHLPEDIKFVQAVRSTRSDVHVEIDGDTAWLISHSKSEGTFEGKPVNSSGVELAVLTRTPDSWRIRAIHWSSHKANKP